MYMFERQINCLVKSYIYAYKQTMSQHILRGKVFNRFIYFSWREILSQQNYTISFSFNIIFIHVYCKDNMLFNTFSALRKFSLRNTYTCITNNYSIYMVIISMLYYLIKTIFINNWNICIKVKNEVNPWLLTCTVLREYIINVHYCIL